MGATPRGDLKPPPHPPNQRPRHIRNQAFKLSPEVNIELPIVYTYTWVFNTRFLGRPEIAEPGVWAAPATPKNISKGGGRTPQPFGRVVGAAVRHPKIKNRRRLAGPRNHVLKTKVCIPKMLRIQKVLNFVFFLTSIDIVGFGCRNDPLRPERQRNTN